MSAYSVSTKDAVIDPAKKCFNLMRARVSIHAIERAIASKRPIGRRQPPLSLFPAAKSFGRSGKYLFKARGMFGLDSRHWFTFTTQLIG
jgi:hypothetical protein